jgi:ATP-binding protein involved in chromosome partitioning
LADEVGVPLLGHVPLNPRVAQAGDDGTPIIVADPQSNAAKALGTVATKVAERMAAVAAR